MKGASATKTLDASGVRQIMAQLEGGRSGRSIADEFGISPSMVSAIKHGRAWSALDPGLPARLARTPRKGKALTHHRSQRASSASLRGSRLARSPRSTESRRRPFRPSRKGRPGRESHHAASSTTEPARQVHEGTQCAGSADTPVSNVPLVSQRRGCVFDVVERAVASFGE